MLLHHLELVQLQHQDASLLCLQVLQEGNKVSTVAGTGTAGFADGQGQSAAFSEPSGLAEGPNGSLLVADTNNGLVRCTSPLCMPTFTQALGHCMSLSH